MIDKGSECFYNECINTCYMKGDAIVKFEAISYNLPANPSRYRVATWKKLRELGAVYLQDGVAMVPQQAGMHDQLEELKENILSWKGRACLLTLVFDREEDEQETLASFAAAREEEYAGIQEDAAQVLAQLERDQKQKKSETDIDRYLLELRRLRRRMETAESHDFFGADKSAARQALEALAAVLPADDKPLRSSKRPAASPKTKPVPTALETAEKLLQLEKEREEQAEREERDDREMPVFLF